MLGHADYAAQAEQLARAWLQRDVPQALAEAKAFWNQLLGSVQVQTSAPLQYGARSIELPLEAVRSVTPMARKLGRADADHHDVDALLARELAGRDEHTVTVPPMSVAAWVQLA